MTDHATIPVPADTEHAPEDVRRGSDTLALDVRLPRARPRLVPRRSKPKGSELLVYRLGVLAVLLCGWEAGVRSGAVDSFFWSQPSEILVTGIEALRSGLIVSNALFTFQSTVAGFVLGVAGGVESGCPSGGHSVTPLLRNPR